MSPADGSSYAGELERLRAELEAQVRRESQALLLSKLVFNISIAFAQRESLATMLKTCCQALVKELGAAFARVWTLDSDSEFLNLQASAGLYKHLDGAHSRVRMGELKIGRIALSREPHLTNDVQHDPQVGDRAWAEREGMVAFAGHPLAIGGQLIGVMAIFSRNAFDENTLQVLATIASIVAHGIDREWLKEERSTLLEKTESALRASERSNEALQRFAAIASHDLQEPLRQVTAFSQMLTRRYRDKLDANGQEYLAFISDGASRMGRLIQGLLAYAQIEAMNLTPLGIADAESALIEALQNLTLSIGESRAVITHDALPKVHGSQLQLAQLFQNLIGNALKYRSEAPPRVHISALRQAGQHAGQHVGQQGDEWIFSVSDNGLGIPPEHRAKIFEVFTRLHGQGISGVGLGLAFCSKIVELHRGRIWVEANDAAPGGSIFYFAIPA